MSTRLERYVWMTTIAVVALSVALLAALPAVAEAQTAEAQEGPEGAPRQAAEQSTDSQSTHYQSTDPPAGLRVVTPGDSLWAIAQEQLGPNAAPESVANEVERIHWLNRDRIGDDPNLILAGQELTLLPAAASTPEPVSSTGTNEPVAASAPEPTSRSSSGQPVAAEPPSEANVEEARAEEPPVLPELPEAEAELVAASVQEPSSAGIPEGNGDARRKAGYAVLLFTFAVTLLGTARLLAQRR